MGCGIYLIFNLLTTFIENKIYVLPPSVLKLQCLPRIFHLLNMLVFISLGSLWNCLSHCNYIIWKIRSSPYPLHTSNTWSLMTSYDASIALSSLFIPSLKVSRHSYAQCPCMLHLKRMLLNILHLPWPLDVAQFYPNDLLH